MRKSGGFREDIQQLLACRSEEVRLQNQFQSVNSYSTMVSAYLQPQELKISATISDNLRNSWTKTVIG